MNRSNEIITDSDGTKRLQNQKEAFEGTDIYKYLISADVNGDNFDSEGNIVPRENGNKVQLPTVGKDKNGKTYFVAHGSKELLYFDTLGNKAEFKDGELISNTKEVQKKQPIINNSQSEEPQQPVLDSNEFAIPAKYSDNQLNLGKVFINGQPAEMDTDANFYRNQSRNNIGNLTLNDGKYTRTDVQLKAGNTMNPKYDDDHADEILSSFLGDNCDKIAISQEKGNPESLELFRKTDFYKAFVSKEVNGDNFVDDKLNKNTELGFNTVQLPSLEVDENGTKFYVLHTAKGILYFDDSGNAIK